MLKPSITELLEMTGSRYSLVIAASKRARQIIDGSEPLTTASSMKRFHRNTRNLRIKGRSS